jgi:hypothetical protein
MKTFNEYAAAVDGYNRIPKAVFAAIAVSSLTQGGDYLVETNDRLLREWWALYSAGIVPQKPNKPEPAVVL